MERRDDDVGLDGGSDGVSGEVIDFETKYLGSVSFSERLAYHARLVDFYNQQRVKDGCRAVWQRLQPLEDWLNQDASD